MPITYDSVNNIIKVVGFTETTPCTFDDIYQASVNGGWGVVEKIGDKLYFLNCRLQIGDGSEATWVADNGKAVRMRGLLIHNYGHLKLGVPSGDYGYNGCLIEVDDYGYVWTDNIVYSLGEFNAYGSIIKFIRDTGRGTVFSGTCNFIGCVFEVENNAVFYLRGNYGLKKCLLSRLGYASLERSPQYFQKVTFYAFGYKGIRVGYTNGTRVVELEAPEFSMGVWWVFIYNNENFTLKLINMQPLDLTKIYVGAETGKRNRVELHYDLEFFVHDKNLNPIAGASIKLYDKNNTLVFSTGTNTEGKASGRVMVAFKEGGDGVTTEENLNPFTLEVEASGYTKFTSKINIEKPLSQDIVLDALNYTLDNIYTLLKKHDQRISALIF